MWGTRTLVWLLTTGFALRSMACFSSEFQLTKQHMIICGVAGVLSVTKLSFHCICKTLSWFKGPAIPLCFTQPTCDNGHWVKFLRRQWFHHPGPDVRCAPHALPCCLPLVARVFVPFLFRLIDLGSQALYSLAWSDISDSKTSFPICPAVQFLFQWGKLKKTRENQRIRKLSPQNKSQGKRATVLIATID